MISPLTNEKLDNKDIMPPSTKQPQNPYHLWFQEREGMQPSSCVWNRLGILFEQFVEVVVKMKLKTAISSPGSHTVLCFFYSFYNSLMAKPNPPTLTYPTEISVTASWTKTEAATAYQILVKSIADEEEIPWTKHNFDSNTLTAEIDGLEPTNTYIFRIIAVLPEGDSEMS